MESDIIIETVDLTKKYNGDTAVNGLSFQVKTGEIFGFLGPNGAGKTTTLLMLLGLTNPSEGSAKICGLNPLRNPIKTKSLVGYLPENIGFYDDMNAVQNLEYIACLNGVKKDKTQEKIYKLLELTGLKQDARKRVGAYSRGMKQRLGFAEILIKDPEIIFLDEPTIGLDPDGALKLMDLIISLNRDRKMTIVLSSHNLHQVQKICHRVGIMINGNLVAEGSVESLAEEKFGLDKKEYSLEEIYMKYFKEV
ncbi:MAG TPA: ABC transporter ATP-binding protein [Desulfobacteraceae bacterium]|nr:ABC transporter ATP-binding protein [Desulfobacteraceae bacterium]